MWTTTASIETPASPEAVWQQYTDVESWKTWDGEIEWSKLDGAFQPGSRGRLKPRGGPATRFELTRVEHLQRFSDVSRLPLARLEFDHTLEPAPGGGTRITHVITIHGPLAPLFARLLGKKLAAGLPAAVQRLAEKAQA